MKTQKSAKRNVTNAARSLNARTLIQRASARFHLVSSFSQIAKEKELKSKITVTKVSDLQTSSLWCLVKFLYSNSLLICCQAITLTCLSFRYTGVHRTYLPLFFFFFGQDWTGQDYTKLDRTALDHTRLHWTDLKSPFECSLLQSSIVQSTLVQCRPIQPSLLQSSPVYYSLLLSLVQSSQFYPNLVYSSLIQYSLVRSRLVKSWPIFSRLPQSTLIQSS